MNAVLISYFERGWDHIIEEKQMQNKRCEERRKWPRLLNLYPKSFLQGFVGHKDIHICHEWENKQESWPPPPDTQSRLEERGRSKIAVSEGQIGQTVGTVLTLRVVQGYKTVFIVFFTARSTQYFSIRNLPGSGCESSNPLLSYLISYTWQQIDQQLSS